MTKIYDQRVDWTILTWSHSYFACSYF